MGYHDGETSFCSLHLYFSLILSLIKFSFFWQATLYSLKNLNINATKVASYDKLKAEFDKAMGERRVLRASSTNLSRIGTVISLRGTSQGVRRLSSKKGLLGFYQRLLSWRLKWPVSPVNSRLSTNELKMPPKLFMRARSILT